MQRNFSSTVAVIGLGKIGLPLAVQYARHGRHVIGCDINPFVVEKIRAGQSHIHEEPELAPEVATLVRQGLLTATTHTTEAARQAGVVVVIVPVVIDEQHEVNFQSIDAATAAIGVGLQPGSLVVYETTLPVGTTAKRFASILEENANLKAGQDFYLAYSPERVSSGSIFHDLHRYPKVVGGINAASREAAVTFYRSVLDAEIIPMASTDEAEFVKLIETTYRDVNIALANEYACFADIFGLDVAATIKAANTQPYSHIHTPGVGVGGHCIPVYPYFLLSSLKETQPLQTTTLQDTHHSLLTLPYAARHINDTMAKYAVQRIEAITGPLAHRSVLILGVAYREGVRETAFTSASLLQDALKACRASVYVDDPLFSANELQALGYTPLLEGDKREICAVILQAYHTTYKFLDLTSFSQCQVLLDGRRALHREHIESMGIHYIAIGDGNYRNQEHVGQQSGKTLALASAPQNGGQK